MVFPTPIFDVSHGTARVTSRIAYHHLDQTSGVTK
jgi:hypothetical protein